MMLSKILAALCLCLAANTVNADEFKHFGDWATEEKAWFLAYTLSSYVDYRQTVYATNLRDEYGNYIYYEKNPLFGNRPNKGKVLALKFLAGAYMYHDIGKWSFKNKRTRYTVIAATALQAAVVVHNDSVGVSLEAVF